jgi:hypothetical protein
MIWITLLAMGVWRVHDPEAANAVLREILRAKGYSREFDYRMDEDPR